MNGDPDHRLIVTHYESCLERHGDTHRGVDWPDAAGAETRYRVMLDLIRPHAEPVSLLDFGCGAAHLCESMRRNGPHDVVYTGLDLSPRFAALARRKFPDVTFYETDLLADPDAIPAFDYIIMNGVFTEKQTLTFDAMFAYFRRLTTLVFAKARLGIAFNVMSTHVDWQRDDLFHLPHDALAAFVTDDLSRHFVMRKDYGLYEYTTYVYR